MHINTGITSEFGCRCPAVYSEEAQKALLVVEQEIYCSERDIAPTDLEHPSMPIRPCKSERMIFILTLH